MSPLQQALALAGVLVLLGVLLHGWWQAKRRSIRRVAADLPPDAVQREPSFAAAADAPIAPGPGAPQRTEPTLTRRAGARIDALIDAVAAITVEAPVAGDMALMHLPPSRRAGNKLLLIEGLNAATGEWESLALGQRYGEFQAAVQLANRGGALNEIEYSEFVQKIQAFADAVGGLPDFPDMLDAVARARELDAFASEHDAQLALRLVTRGAAWSPAYIQQHAGRHGFVPGALPGRLVLPAGEDGAPPVLSLQFDAQAALADDPEQAAVGELTLAFDVPQTASSEAPFSAWCASGEALSLALDATLYDDGGQPLNPAVFPAIGDSLEELYAALSQRELAAGSGAARRLFS